MQQAAYIPLRARDGSIRAYAIVDGADLEWLGQWRWHRTKKGHVGRVQLIAGRVRGFRMAREMLGLTADDPRQADHINRDPLDNRRSNLRILPGTRENCQNKSKQSTYKGGPPTSRFRGVSRTKNGKWCAYASVSNRNHWLGTFDSEEVAAEAARRFRQVNMPFSTT